MLWCGNELCRFTDWLTLFLGSWYKEEINSCLYTSFIITGWKLIVLYIIYLSSLLCFPSQIIKDFPSQSILVFLYGFSHLSSKLFTLPFEAHIFHMSLECGWHDKLVQHCRRFQLSLLSLWKKSTGKWLLPTFYFMKTYQAKILSKQKEKWEIFLLTPYLKFY